jgi:molybdate/tungstate transport system substrate-binding protein
MMPRFLLAWLLISLLMALPCGCHRKPARQTLTIFHAGSLSIPFREVSTLFEKRHPDIEVRAEAAGSRDCARKITDLHRPCDVFGSADEQVTQTLLMPEYTDFSLRFATNEMVLAYTDRSQYSSELRDDNWPEILSREEVRLGRADPDRDPCGYRTLMVLQLGERHYGLPGLAERLEAKGGGRFLRANATDLVALMDAGEIDYMFAYRSICAQHYFQYLRLPREVNLADPDLAATYATATVEVTGKQPGETITMTGTPIVYSVSIPRDAPNRPAAEAWVALLLSPEGQAVMESNGQPALAPPTTDQPEELPDALRPLCSQAGD